MASKALDRPTADGSDKKLRRNEAQATSRIAPRRSVHHAQRGA